MGGHAAGLGRGLQHRHFAAALERVISGRQTHCSRTNDKTRLI